MRPNQHKNRSRGRNRHRSGSSGSGGGGGGGGGNPLNRVYESNGPDVKVRGTAQTVAEKYLQLGRDAQASSDIVMSESYFQHAEHYLRILAAAQAYNQQMQQQFRRPGEEFDDEDGDEGDDSAEGDDQGTMNEQAEQPAVASDQGGEEEFRPQQSQQNREYRQRDRDRGSNRPRYEGRRDNRDGQEPQRDNQQPREHQLRDSQPLPQPRAEEPVAAEPSQAATASETSWEAPSFLRKPSVNGAPRSRRPRREATESGDAAAAEPAASAEVPAVD